MPSGCRASAQACFGAVQARAGAPPALGGRAALAACCHSPPCLLPRQPAFPVAAGVLWSRVWGERWFTGQKAAHHRRTGAAPRGAVRWSAAHAAGGAQRRSEHAGLHESSAPASDVEAEWERTMDALHDLITKRHRERLQTDSIDAMHDYLARLDLDVGRLRVIHVAGTKGKGSTCTMVESILRAKGYRTALYTSPHLMDVRERIRIDGAQLPKHVFARYFWEVHEQLRRTADAPSTRFPAMPGYFRFLTLLAFKVFLSSDVDVAVIEVGLGGRLDATNVVSPLTCGITSLDYDHTNVLGDTLAEIAFEKAGILKPSVPSFTAPQAPEALEVLYARAHARAHTHTNTQSHPHPHTHTHTHTLSLSLSLSLSLYLSACLSLLHSGAGMQAQTRSPARTRTQGLKLCLTPVSRTLYLMP